MKYGPMRYDYESTFEEGPLWQVNALDRVIVEGDNIYLKIDRYRFIAEDEKYFGIGHFRKGTYYRGDHFKKKQWAIQRVTKFHLSMFGEGDYFVLPPRGDYGTRHYQVLAIPSYKALVKRGSAPIDAPRETPYVLECVQMPILEGVPREVQKLAFHPNDRLIRAWPLEEVTGKETTK